MFSSYFFFFNNTNNQSQLVDLYGFDARVYRVTCLVNLDMNKSKGITQFPANSPIGQKIQLLQHDLLQLSVRPAFRPSCLKRSGTWCDEGGWVLERVVSIQNIVSVQLVEVESDAKSDDYDRYNEMRRRNLCIGCDYLSKSKFNLFQFEVDHFECRSGESFSMIRLHPSFVMILW